MSSQSEISPKSYGVAVALCGIFGTMGIHHFYLGDFLHGLADLALLGIGVWLIMSGQPGLGSVVILADAVHTIVIFYLLIVEKWRDGNGLPVRLR